MSNPTNNNGTNNPWHTSGRLSNRLSGRLDPQPSPFPLPLPSAVAHNTATLSGQANALPLPTTLTGRTRRALGWQTLTGQFNSLALLASLLALLALVVAFTRLSDTASQFRQLGANSAPSIVAADDLSRQLNDLDTHAADLLITSAVAKLQPQLAAQIKETPVQAQTGYTQALQTFNNTIFRAYGNVTFSGEAPTIRALLEGLENYSSQIGVMQSEIWQGHFEAALAAYKRAHDFVIGNPNHLSLNTTSGFTGEELLKQSGWANFKTDQNYLGLEANARKLYTINHTELDKSYAQAQGVLTLNEVLIIVAGTLLALVLLGLVVRYAVVTHRAVNPGFVPAFGIALALLIILAIFLSRAGADFKTVAADSFSSIDSASQAEQLLQDFNGDESRLLLNPQLLGLNTNDPALTADVKQAFDGNVLKRNFEYKKQQILRLVGAAWGNVTYPEEPAALCTVYDNPQPSNRPYQEACQVGSQFALTSYFAAHDQIMSYYNQANESQALLVSYGPSNTAQGQALNGLAKLSGVNEGYFDQASCDSIGESEFNTHCSSARTKAGLVVEKAGITNLHQDQTGYLDMLVIMSVAGFTLLIVATGAGIYLTRRLF